MKTSGCSKTPTSWATPGPRTSAQPAGQGAIAPAQGVASAGAQRHRLPLSQHPEQRQQTGVALPWCPWGPPRQHPQRAPCRDRQPKNLPVPVACPRARSSHRSVLQSPLSPKKHREPQDPQKRTLSPGQSPPLRGPAAPLSPAPAAWSAASRCEQLPRQSKRRARHHGTAHLQRPRRFCHRPIWTPVNGSPLAAGMPTRPSRVFTPAPPPNSRCRDVTLLCHRQSSEVTGSHRGRQLCPLPWRGELGGSREQGWRRGVSRGWSRAAQRGDLLAPAPKGPAGDGAGSVPGSQISAPGSIWECQPPTAWENPISLPCPGASWQAQLLLEVGCCDGCQRGRTPAPSPQGAYGHAALAPLHPLCGMAETGEAGTEAEQGAPSTARGPTRCRPKRQCPQGAPMASPRRAGLLLWGGESRPPPRPPSSLALQTPSPCLRCGESLQGHHGSTSPVPCSNAHPLAGRSLPPCSCSGRAAGLGKGPAPKYPSPKGRVPLHTKGLHRGSPHPCPSDRPGFRSLNNPRKSNGVPGISHSKAQPQTG